MNVFWMIDGVFLAAGLLVLLLGGSPGLWIALMVLALLLAAIMTYWIVLNSMYPETLRTNEIYTVTTPDLWKLRVCRYRKGRMEGEPILFVHGFNSNQHNFTCPDGKSMVDYLSGRGYDCWAVDLRGCRSSVAPFEHSLADTAMDDYVMNDIPAVIQFIRKTTGYAKVHWVGHSMGGMLLYAYELVHGPQYIASGVTLGGPVGFEGAKAHVPKPIAVFAGAFPRVAGNILRGFVPFIRLIGSGLFLYPVTVRNVHSEMNTGHFIGMLEDPLPKVLKEIAFSLNNKVFRVNNDTVDVVGGLSQLCVPLLAIYAARDPFAPPEQGEKFIRQLPHEDKKILVLSKAEGCVEDYDHVDLVMSREGAREVFEPMRQWFEAHPIRERLNLVDEEEERHDIRRPLSGVQRAHILSGRSYAHLSPENHKAAKAQKARRPARGSVRKKTSTSVRRSSARKKTVKTPKKR
ncbi:MAG TPA: alpha/beta hydrolase [Candidatus Hydrogenedentes bacterium]|nr:alpha/beta hydrolase [Candidatus Hydrogenedentota bacterium]